MISKQQQRENSRNWKKSIIQKRKNERRRRKKLLEIELAFDGLELRHWQRAFLGNPGGYKSFLLGRIK